MEIWDGYLKDGSFAGVDLVRGEQIPSGLYHLACDVIIKHLDGDFLLVQRDYKKEGYGGYFELSAGGSALKGETPIKCARREVREETGITNGKFKRLGKEITKNVIFVYYLFITDCDKNGIKLQEGETISYKWINERELKEFISSDEIIPTQKSRYHGFFKKNNYL